MNALSLTNTRSLVERVCQLHDENHSTTAVTLITSDSEEQITYGQLMGEAARYADAFEAAGVQPGDLVVLVLQHGKEVMFAFWGAMLLGAIPSIFPFLTEKLDPDLYFESVKSLVEISKVKAIVTYPELLPKLKFIADGSKSLDTILTADDLKPRGESQRWLAQPLVCADSTAFLQHSSGSTGLQKGVALSHKAVLSQLRNYGQVLGVTSEDVIVSWLPLYHDMGLIAGFILPLMYGLPLILMSPFEWVRDPKLLLHAITHYKGTLCWLPNFAYNFLAMRLRDRDLDGVDLSSLRAIINCSEPVSAESHRRFVARFKQYGFAEKMLATCYAMAENTFAVTQSKLGIAPMIDSVDRASFLDEQKAEPANGTGSILEFVSCGKPIPGCELLIVDNERKSLPERMVGEIVIRSDSMLTGYFNRPDLTRDAVQQGWYFTGDMGYIADGELFVTGRKKDMIIIGGKNIYPQDIEALLNEVSGIHPGRSVAFGVYNKELGTEDLAIVAEVDGMNAEAHSRIVREVRSRVVRQLGIVARFVHLVERGWIIKTSSGKVARRANREKFLKEVLGVVENG